MLFLVTLLFAAAPSRAEYRVFELHFTDEATGLERTEISNFDPAVYVQYHAHGLTEKLVYVSTWMCKGNTSYQSFCPNPKAK